MLTLYLYQKIALRQSEMKKQHGICKGKDQPRPRGVVEV